MKFLYINFIGEDWTNILSGRVEESDATPVSPLNEIVKGSIGNATPGQIKLPKYDNSTVEKLLRYAAPNLTNDDYYPEKTVNSIIGSASNKTLGTFPIFSSAALMPAGLWDKRRKAIGDYMLELEKAKTQKDPGLTYQYQPVAGASPWVNAYNSVMVDDLDELQKKGSIMGISMRDAEKVGHPFNPEVNRIISGGTSGLRAVTEIDNNVKSIVDKGLNLDNRIGSKAAEKIELYRTLSSLPEDNVVDGELIGLPGIKFNGKRELVRSEQFKDLMSELNAGLQVDNDLLSLADNRVKQIEKNSIEEAKIAGYGSNYIQFTKDKIATKYPVKKDANGNIILDSNEQYLDDLAEQVMKSRPAYFKETSKNPDRAEYTKDDLKDIFAHSLGIERLHAEPIAITGEGGGGSATNTVNAAPQYVKGTLEKLNRGEVIEGKSGKSTIIPGEHYTTYITNGQMRVVPNDDIVENAKAIAEAGGADNEYGSVDAPTAITQMNTGSDVETTYGEFKKVRPVKQEGERIIINKNDSQQQRFNQAVKAIGTSGIPISGAGDVLVSRMVSRKSDKSDSEFYFDLKSKGSNVVSTGVIIPKEKVLSSVEVPDNGIWTKIFGKNTDNVYIAKDQNVAMLEGAYYKYQPATSKEVECYVVYDKNTNSPYKFPTKNKFEEPVPIKLSVSYVKGLVGTPERELEKANKKYPKPTQSPNATQQTSISDVKTKTGGKGQTMTVENSGATSETKEQRAINHFKKQGYSQEKAVKFMEQYRDSKDKKLQEQWNKF